MAQPSRAQPLRSLIQRAHYSSVTIMKKVIIWGAVLLVVGYFLLAVLPVMFMLVMGGGFDP